MTEREQFVAMLTRAGVVFTIEIVGEAAKEMVVSIEATSLHPAGKNRGYSGFTASFHFDDKTGQLVSTCIVE